MISEIQASIKRHWLLYLFTLSICAVLKGFSRIADCDAYLWILTPTTRWVSILCGISFDYLPHSGYVNHLHQFLIAPTCSGVRFMMIVFLMLSLSFLHQINSKKAGSWWFILSVLFSYTATVFVNGIRISAAIFLPDLLTKAGLLKGWLNPDRLHTLIGTVVYFTALCLIYPLASSLCKYKFLQISEKPSDSSSTSSLRLLTPAFWYLLIVLAIPFGTRILRGNWIGFGQYTLLILCTCLPLTGLIYLLGRLRR